MREGVRDTHIQTQDSHVSQDFRRVILSMTAPLHGEGMGNRERTRETERQRERERGIETERERKRERNSNKLTQIDGIPTN